MAEIQSWQSQDIISPEQAQAIISSYGVSPQLARSQRAYGRLIAILAIIGTVLIGLGVILFFASNRLDDLPDEAQLSLILIAILAAYGLGYWLKYRRGYQRVGTAVILLAALLYGAGIHLVAQVYNFPVNDPNLFMYWFLGVIPLAYLTKSQAILVLAIGLFLGAVGFRLPGWLDGNYSDYRGEVIASSVLYLTLGLTLYGLGRLQALYDLTRSYSRIYDILGMLTIVISLYLLGFRWLFNDYQDVNRFDVNISTGFWVLFYLSAVLGVALLASSAVVQARRRLPMMTLPYEGAAALLLLVAAYLVVYLEIGHDVFYPILFNALLFLGIVGLVFDGYFRRREALINIALIFFSVGVISRYFELGWDLYDRSLVFIVAGIILLGGGFLLERGRRKVFDRMTAQRAGNES